jgi:hypothetical protein
VNIDTARESVRCPACRDLFQPEHGRITIPGLGSRLEDQRCETCCELTGLPPGKGSPKNDEGCRRILGITE